MQDSRIKIQEFNASRFRLEAAGEKVEQRGLAGAVFTAQEDDFARADFAGDAVGRALAAEGFFRESNRSSTLAPGGDQGRG